jgi:hypothetical protein
MPCTEAQLRAMRKWQHNNPELYKKSYTTCRMNNIDLVRDKDRKRKMYFYQCKLFRNILIE